MSSPHIAAVMIHVPNISEATALYERVFPNAQRSSTDEEEFESLLVGEVRLEVVLADQKASGPGGPIVYWQFPQFEAWRRARRAADLPIALTYQSDSPNAFS